jgi:hypothetical protein
MGAAAAAVPVAVPQVSGTTEALFALTVAGVVAIFVGATGFGARRAGEPPHATRAWTGIAVLAVAVWLSVPAGIAASGALLRFSARPPAFLVMMPLVTVSTAILARSPLGTRLAAGLGFEALIGFQVFRIVVEGLLTRMYQEGAIPVQMTFYGYNFDILTGLLAAVVAMWARRGDPPRWAILGFNLVGIVLLLNVASIAIMSQPTGLRYFHNEPALTIVATVPYVWLPTFLVQAAWFAHLLVFRRLLLQRA